MRWAVPLRILCPWRIKFSFVKEGVSFYEQRLKRYVSFFLDQRRVRAYKDHRPDGIKAVEGKTLLAAVNAQHFVVALDERGRLFDSLKWAKYLQGLLEGQRELVFIIGGPYGLAPEVLERADLRLSLSPFTLGHEIALLVFLEQLYRAFTILSGEPYHK